MKIVKWIIVVGLLSGGTWIAWKWYAAQQGLPVDALSLIPRNAIYCLVADHPVESWKELSSSETWKHLQKNNYFAKLTSSANALDSLLQRNDLLFDLLGDHKLIVSAHMTGAKKYDFLFLADLEGVAGIKFMNEYLTDFSTSGFSVHAEKYNDHDLTVFHSTVSNTNLYIGFSGTYLLASYTKAIVTQAFDTSETMHNDESFMSMNNLPIGIGGFMQLYLNYKLLPALVSCYSSGQNEYVNQLSKSLYSTSLQLTLNDELLKATGFTYVNDSVESYLKTLSISGKAATEFMEITPRRTAFCLGLGFTSLQTFFENFEKNLQADVSEYKSYRQNLKQVEDYLNIDLHKNFVNWVGDEIALLELQSYGAGHDNEMAMVLKADNIEQAKKDLAYIEKKVRRKTPIKFKTVEYKGYEINYLSMKGLFKILLGKFFARYDKPYYTTINNFVIFSSHPQTLESIIDDYQSKNTLIKSEEFRDFRREFKDEGSVFIYLNTPVLFNTLKKLADAPTRNAMEKNKEYIVNFRQAGFQLVPNDGKFTTIFAERFVAPQETTVPILQEDRHINDTIPLHNENTSSDVDVEDADPMALPYIYAQDLDASSFTDYFADSTVHFIVDLKNGFKSGSFTEYHKNGEVKMTGHFKRDEREGTWRLYDESGNLILKRNYKKGEIDE